MCLLLSLAHSQARNSTSRQQATHTVCAIFDLLLGCALLITQVPSSRDDDQEARYRYYVYLYEADIKSQLLDCIDQPTLATERVAWPTINLKRTPFRPFNNFQARLVAELLTCSPPETP